MVVVPTRSLADTEATALARLERLTEEARPVMTTSSRLVASSRSFTSITRLEGLTLMIWVKYPKVEITRLTSPSESTSRLNLPSRSVTVPLALFWMTTLAYSSGSPVRSSETVPLTVYWADSVPVATHKRAKSPSLVIPFFSFGKQLKVMYFRERK